MTENPQWFPAGQRQAEYNTVPLRDAAPVVLLGLRCHLNFKR